jgi:2-haloacid dehalogenase
VSRDSDRDPVRPAPRTQVEVSPARSTRVVRGYDAVLFDLLSALLDSWTVWNVIAGDAERGRRWRMRYLEITYAEGRYRDYLSLVAEAAEQTGITPGAAMALDEAWDEIAPWPEAADAVARLCGRMRVGIVTNCSESLAVRAAARLGVEWDAIVSAERSGWYKPAAGAYAAGLEAMAVPADRTLFVAGSPFDVSGAAAAGMDVYFHDRAGLAGPPHRVQALAVEPTLDGLPVLAGETLSSKQGRRTAVEKRDGQYGHMGDSDRRKRGGA